MAAAPKSTDAGAVASVVPLVGEQASAGAEAAANLSKRGKKRKRQAQDADTEWQGFYRQLIACIKASDVTQALSLYEELRSKGHGSKVRGMVYNGLLHLCSEGDQAVAGQKIFGHMQEAGIPPQENSYGFMISELSKKGALQEAFELIQDMVKQGIHPRTRTYGPLLQTYREKGLSKDAWVVWSHLRDQKVVPGPSQYEGLLGTFAMGGDLWARVADGTVDQLLDELSYQANELEEGIIDGLKATFNLGRPKPVAARVSVSDMGVCSGCGAQLKPVGLKGHERERVSETMSKLAADTPPPKTPQGAGGAGGAPAAAAGGALRAEAAQHAQPMEVFRRWLEERRSQGVTFTMVLDVPNVAYHRQNVPDGAFQLLQVDAMIDHATKLGERVLLICPERYLAPVVPNTTKYGKLQKRKHTFSPRSLAIIRKWEEQQILYRCPNGSNDDWFWMYASVAFDDAPMAVVSNDLMRDHWVEMLEPMPFRRWKDTQIRRFNMGTPLFDHMAAGVDPRIELGIPPTYTRDIQVADNRAWHLPVANSTQWLCLDLAKSSQNGTH